VYKPNARREGVSIRQTWVAAGFFSGGGQIRGSGNESPPSGVQGGSLVVVWDEAPRS